VFKITHHNDSTGTGGILLRGLISWWWQQGQWQQGQWQRLRVCGADGNVTITTELWDGAPSGHYCLLPLARHVLLLMAHSASAWWEEQAETAMQLLPPCSLELMTQPSLLQCISIALLLLLLRQLFVGLLLLAVQLMLLLNY
jgi:hypothetical protein